MKNFIIKIVLIAGICLFAASNYKIFDIIEFKPALPMPHFTDNLEFKTKRLVDASESLENIDLLNNLDIDAVLNWVAALPEYFNEINYFAGTNIYYYKNPFKFLNKYEYIVVWKTDRKGKNLIFFEGASNTTIETLIYSIEMKKKVKKIKEITKNLFTFIPPKFPLITKTAVWTIYGSRVSNNVLEEELKQFPNIEEHKPVPIWIFGIIILLVLLYKTKLIEIVEEH